MVRVPIYTMLLLVFIFLIVSCDSNRVYETNKSIGEGNWSMIDTACFEVDIVDTLSLNNFYINLRHSTSYKFSNIFLFFHTTFPNGYSTCDTLQILLADNTGKWIGSGMGKIKECRVLLKDRVQFPHSGVYSFCIEQAMRNEPLEGVEDNRYPN
ncbi:MAG: gliding motility lipoprotein GldH [Bacteroidales bacterium]